MWLIKHISTPTSTVPLTSHPHHMRHVQYPLAYGKPTHLAIARNYSES